MENQNQSPKAQLVERLKEANNVLVTVSRNPSVDQLSSAIGLTLMLNELGKHATAVFSGQVPSTLEFLKPEETLEKTTDSLRDFIISLDKAKADKLRYKVEDKMVKIFITPYRTSLSESDLVYEQGDFNVDVIVAIGVHEKEELDEAITSHGRILHDATVASVNTTTNGQLGSINWVDNKASSLSEMLVTVCEALKAGSLDPQMSTAFLTGIVAETARFSNEKTSSDTMNISAKLMSAGANQQLVATKLEQPAEPKNDTAEIPQDNSDQQGEAATNDGSLDIEHTDSEEKEPENSDLPEVQPDHEPEQNDEQEEAPTEDDDKPSRLILEPPTLGGKLTANTEPEALDPSTDPLTLAPIDSPLLSHADGEEKLEPAADIQEPEASLPVLTPLEPASLEPEAPVLPELPTLPTPPSPPEAPEMPELKPIEQPEQPELTPPEVPIDTQTLAALESSVDSAHVADAMIQEHDATQQAMPDPDQALAAAHEAFDAIATDAPEKPAAFNSTGLMDVGHDEPAAETVEETPAEEPLQELAPAPVTIDPTTGTLEYPTNLVPPTGVLPTDPTAGSLLSPSSAPEAPEVPPPMTFPPLMSAPEPPANGQIDPNNLPPVTP